MTSTRPRRTRVYVVTYRRPEVLEAALDSLYAGMYDPERVDVVILNNHSDFQLPAVASSARVVHNTVRPDHSWGYLARDWNWCLLDAFTDWRGSGVEWCLLAQNDAMWADDWQMRLDALEGVDFFTQPVGDQSMGFRLEGLRRVGFFDERFTTLHYQEQDYFNRAAAILRDRASIDDGHFGADSGRAWFTRGLITTHRTSHGMDAEDDILHTRHSHAELQQFALRKWSIGHQDELFDRPLMVSRLDAGVIPLPQEIDWYPYFWHGYPGDRRGLEDYTDTYAPPARSILIVEDDRDALVERLTSASHLVVDGSVEVLVDCRDAAAVRDVREAVGPSVVFVAPDPASSDQERRRERLTRMARGREKILVGQS